MSFETFDRVYVIHLPNPARRRAMEAELARWSLSATFVHAKPPVGAFTMSNMRRAPLGEFGANASHLKAITQAALDGAARPLFLEDDVVFREDAAERFERAERALPSDWDVLYLGGHPRERVTPVGEGLCRVRTFSCAEAYALRGPALLRFIKFWCDRITQPNAMFDFILGEFAAANRGYAVHPVLTDQVAGVSQISHQYDDKRPLVQRGWTSNL
jgi:GR25 family glycosyltransferase involved in LPS biosynthesis